MANGIVLNIDTTKSEFQNPMVQLRQGDGNYQSLDVTVTSNGEPFDLTGWTTTFMGTTAGGFKIIDSAVTVTNALQGSFTYTPNKAWGQDQGEFKNAYFKFTKSDETASGASFRVNVLDAVDLTAEEAGDYISVVDGMINDVKTSMDTKLVETKQTLADTQSQADTVQTNVNVLGNRVDEYNNKLADIKVGGRNLMLGTADWSGGGSRWNQRESVTKNTYLGTVIAATSKEFNNTPVYTVKNAGILQVGKTYTFSTYIRNTSDTDAKIGYYYAEGMMTPGFVDISLPAHTYWTRIFVTFQIIKDPTTTIAGLRWESKQDVTNGEIQFAGYKLEKGNVPTDWTPAPEDVPSNDSNLVHKTGTETVAGDKTFTGNNTFTQNISGNITGNSGTTTKLQTPRKINGTTFDSTQDVTIYRVNDSDVILNTSFEKFETDKAHYHPLELVEFLFEPKANAGNLAITYYKRNELVATQHIAYDSQTVQWHWRLPGDDIEAYIVKVVNTVKGQSETFYHAINVSWDQKDRPLMGFLSKFGEYNNENQENIMKYLKRLHINYIQYYDWFDRHEMPMRTTWEGYTSHYWGDFVNRPTRFDTIHKYIDTANKFGMLSMAYGLINGASHNTESEGLTKDMFMFDNDSKDLGSVTNSDLTPWAKYVLYQMNFMVDSWQDYFTKETANIYKYLPFDGWHIDTLGDPGNKYDSNGKNITSDNWKAAYPYFINKAISNSNAKRAGLNAVAEYGQKEIATSNADYIYTEVWGNRTSYNDMMNLIIEMRNLSDKELIIAGYMHHDWSNNGANNTNLVFNDPAVILTDLVIMASGATHLEMGEHMLTTEYFPNNKLSMSDALKDYLVKIYDLQVAFKRLFKIKNKAKVDMVSSTHAILNNFMQKGNLSIISKEDDWYRVDSIINMIGLNGDTWRDDGKDRNYPTFQDNVMVGYPNHGDYKHFYVVDPKNPVPTEVFPDSNGNFNIPHLEFYTLVYATKF